MASEILGLFASPELYQQNQDLLRQQQALQYAQLDPYDRVTYGANLAGQRFGSTLGNVLGGTDPQLRIISARQSVMQGVDPSNPESILRAAQQLADVGDQQGALTLADYARKAGSELALQQQRLREGRAASTPKELQIANATAQLQQRIRELKAAPESPERNAELQIATDTLARLTATTKSANVPKEIEIANARAALQGRIRALEKQPESEERNSELQLARDTLASLPQAGGRAGQVPDAIEIARELALEAGEPGTEAYNKSYRDNLKRLSSKDSSEKQLEFSRILIEAGYTPGTPEYQAEMKRYAMAEITGRSQGKGTQISLGGINLDTGKAGEAAGKKIGEELVDVKGKEAALDSITEARKMLNNGIYAGAYGPAKQFVAKYTGVGSAEKVANTETFLAFIGETVVPRLKEFGGNDSEQELAYLNKIMGGDITVEPKTLARILDQAEIKIKRGIERLRRQAESGEKKQTLTSTLPPTSAAPAPAPALAAPAASAAPAAPVTPRPTKRWNPATRKLEAIQ